MEIFYFRLYKVQLIVSDFVLMLHELGYNDPIKNLKFCCWRQTETTRYYTRF